MRDRNAFMNLPQPDVGEIRGNLHGNDSAILYLSPITIHFFRISDLRRLADVSGRLADELEAAQQVELSENDRLRARIRELTGGDEQE